MQCNISEKIKEWTFKSPRLRLHIFLKNTPIYNFTVFFIAEVGAFNSMTVGFWKASGCVKPGSWQSRDVPLLLPQWQADGTETDPA